jgi:hypothetical protein
VEQELLTLWVFRSTYRFQFVLLTIHVFCVVLLKHPLSFSPLVPTVVFAAIIQFTTLLVSSDCSFLFTNNFTEIQLKYKHLFFCWTFVYQIAKI